MNIDNFINFMMEDLIFERILEQSVDSHLNELYKKNNKYKIIAKKKKIEKEEKCSICLENIEKNSEVFELSCGHFFHSECLEESVSHNHIECPTCRRKLPIHDRSEHFIQYH